MKSLIKAGYDARQEWLQGAGTDSYRIFHGAAEGAPGLSVDRYGTELLVQVFREEMECDWQDLANYLGEIDEQFTGVRIVRRGRAGRSGLATWGELAERTICKEAGLRFWNSLVQVGNDPWFYLDFRSARRFVASVSKGARVANFFSYTGSAGVVAAHAGASQASNIDFGRWRLEVAKENATLNEVDTRIVRDDFFSVARQWAGGSTKNRRKGKRGPSYKPESFDLVILDPPTQSNGPYGAVDILRDYPSLAKPCMQMINSGGWLLCSHHHSGMSFDEWQSIVNRCATKIGRTLLQEKRILPDRDFPMAGNEPLLKVLAIQLD